MPARSDLFLPPCRGRLLALLALLVAVAVAWRAAAHDRGPKSPCCLSLAAMGRAPSAAIACSRHFVRASEPLAAGHVPVAEAIMHSVKLHVGVHTAWWELRDAGDGTPPQVWTAGTQWPWPQA